ncbi:MAG: NADPH-dependent 7-cyano-7-deazaguanine reductase QueF [Gammaproteobacteria bacterium]|nr:NADPH-dependent 7-cyano-7-deazaguanine reductase QueF [Gammaproteobacteria bacterium]MYE29176.1 NADPH-dependent 7-cyano-7-deazaguanine reductase QueF [Gammaproteobacteria bacterium]MYI02364.1 NADPH-dependent 7-cyano-7-deazaguanine reductase QueF [Gammaproteobacteria bacterium]
MTENPLGRSVAPPENYAPELLYPIPRKRVAGDKGHIVHGLDHWRAYELSWLDGNGKPDVFFGEFIFPADSPSMVESKSLKLYLAGLNQERFDNTDQAAERIRKDLANCCGADPEVRIWGLTNYPDDCRLGDFSLIDHHPVSVADGPDADLLATGADSVGDRKIRTELFRSICPVTGQPDWASVAIAYDGREIPEAALLSYLCSFRSHAAWHERCAEQAFRDIMRVCEPEQLSLSMHFLRRGGLEINVYRSTAPVTPEQLMGRDARQ